LQLTNTLIILHISSHITSYIDCMTWNACFSKRDCNAYFLLLLYETLFSFLLKITWNACFSKRDCNASLLRLYLMQLNLKCADSSWNACFSKRDCNSYHWYRKCYISLYSFLFFWLEMPALLGGIATGRQQFPHPTYWELKIALKSTWNACFARRDCNTLNLIMRNIEFFLSIPNLEMPLEMSAFLGRIAIWKFKFFINYI